MGRVKILPEEVVSKIAAGEVIERPASVVKELVENSLDAEAGKINIALKKAGKSLICVKDDGTGIHPDDLEIIFSRHATSKIFRPADLNFITSLGFRGEALYSIAAVSDVLVRSCSKQFPAGKEIHLRAGVKVGEKTFGGPSGTEVEVRELFYNVPVRRKFLKKDEVEFSQVVSTVLPYTLIHPDISFVLTHNDHTVFHLPARKDFRERIEEALNLKRKHLLTEDFDFPEDGFRFQLILGDINIRRVRKDLQFVFVNKRPVYNRSISALLNEVFSTIFPPEVKGFFFVSIFLPPENVDVNIHPTKREVKLANEQIVLSRLQEAAENLLLTQGKMRQVEVSFPPVRETAGKISEEEQKTDIFQSSPVNEEVKSIAEPAEPFDSKNLREKLTRGRYVGSFAGKYLLFEATGSLIVVDQHAAHERIVYEQLLTQFEQGRVEVQNLLTPLVMELSPQEMLSWSEGQQQLEEIGFATTQFDRQAIAVHSYPVVLSFPDVSLRNILAGGDLRKDDKQMLACRACRQAVMAGRTLSEEEAVSLKNDLLRCQDPYTCPHGRPTCVEIKEDFMDQQFLRRK